MTHDTPEIVDHGDRGGQQDAEDAPRCQYGDCQNPAAEVYKVASPTGPLRMRACPFHAPETAAPVEVVDGG